MKAKQLMRRLRKLARNRGWDLSTRQGAGSHMVLTLNGKRTVLPMHSEDLKTGTYRSILRDLAITETDLED